MNLSFDFLFVFLIFALLLYISTQITSKVTKNMKRKKMFKNAKKGDRIYTYSGRKGKVVKIEDDTVEIELDSGKYALFRKEGIDRIEQR